MKLNMQHPRLPNPDCWYGIKDANERKKIQNRLAQRKKRSSQRTKRSELNDMRSADLGVVLTWPASLSRSSSEMRLERSPIPTTSVVTVVPLMKGDQSVEAEIPPSVFAALWDNGSSRSY